jgi:hypothetical protein
MKYLMMIIIVFAVLNFLVPRAQQDLNNRKPAFSMAAIDRTMLSR